MVMGALYASCLFLGVNNAASVQPIVSIERTVFYRESSRDVFINSFCSSPGNSNATKVYSTRSNLV